MLLGAVCEQGVPSSVYLPLFPTHKRQVQVFGKRYATARKTQGTDSPSMHPKYQFDKGGRAQARDTGVYLSHDYILSARRKK